MRLAPWKDFAGNDICEGDIITHPSGESGKVVFVPDGEVPEDQWMVAYVGSKYLSRLCLQIGDRGQAVIASADTDKNKQEANNNRYIIYIGSKSAHCCFEATVMDATKPEIIGGEHYKDSSGQFHYETICECFSLEYAELVRSALNSKQPTTI